jgi:hypothetical protein
MFPRKYLWLYISLALLASVGSLWIVVSRMTNEKNLSKSIMGYTCPMGCLNGKVYPEPGNCPVCHMKLKPLFKKGSLEESQGTVESQRVPNKRKPIRSIDSYRIYYKFVDRIVYTAGRLSPNGLLLYAEIDPSQIPGIQKGQEVLVSPGGGGITRILGKVQKVPAGGWVVCELSRPALGNRYARVEISADGPLCLAVPTGAVWQNGDKNYVFLMNKAPYQQCEVKLGVWGEHFVQVTQGLHEGDVVASSGLFWLASEMYLKGSEPTPLSADSPQGKTWSF